MANISTHGDLQADQEDGDDEHHAIREALKARYGRALAADQKKGKNKDQKNNQEHVMMKTHGRSLDQKTNSMEGVGSSRDEWNIYNDDDRVQEGSISVSDPTLVSQKERPKKHRGKNKKRSDISESFSETSLTTGKATDKRHLLHGAEKECVLPAVVKAKKKANKGKDGGRASSLKSTKKDELKGESILDDTTLLRDRSMKLSELQCTDANGDERGLVKGKTEVTGDSTAAGDGGTKVEKMNKVNNSSWRLEPLSSRPHIQSLSEDGANAVVKAQKIRKKKKAVKAADGHSVENDDAIGPASAEPAKQTDAVPDCKFEDDGQVLIVCVHRADALRTDPAHSSPVVRVHVVDELTGRHVLKEHSPDVPLHTMITCPYDFRRARSLRPEWEEQLVFSERFGRFIEAAHGGPRTLIFFEIMESNRKQNPNEHEEMGKHALAWAFLKLEGANGTLNVGNKVRLQLFAPSVLRRISSNMLHVFEWYSRIGRQRYPSTLYVTVMAGQPPQQVQAIIGPLSHTLMSQGELKDPETQQVENSDSSLTSVSGQTQKWSRLPGQACQIPNKLLLSLPAGSAGCFRIAFSHDGQLLAVACAHRDIHPIRLYEIPSGKLLAELHGHLSIVYDLCWSSDDKHLLSASADTTAQIWAIASPREASIILPHPAFVYAARFHPRMDVAIPSLAITGGYDGMLRAWTAEKPTAHLLRELEGHTGYVNAICFDPDGLMMFSGDSVGVILIWSTFVDQAAQGNPTGGWTLHKSVKEDELKGVPINHLNLHPNGRQLLVHAREGALRLLDLRISAIRKFTWLNNFREWLHSTITPCGTFLFAGSESGSICIWNANTGDKVTMYSDLGFSVPARDVAYHPHDHLVAFCAYGENHRVLLYSYDHSVAQLEASNMIGIKAGVTQDHLSMTVIGVQDPVSSLSMAGMSRLSSRAQRVKLALDSVLQEPLDVHGCPIGNNSENLDKKDSRPWRSSNDKNVSTQSQCVPELSQHAQLLPNTHAHHASALPLSGRSFTTEGRLSSRPSLHFRMLGTEDKITGIEVNSDGDTSHYEMVVALYDYVARRSDEIALKCGDRLQVLYKDTVDWWFGIGTDGTQGYFPANYVSGSGNLSPPVALCMS